MMRIISWNVAHRLESWRRLPDMDIDLACRRSTLPRLLGRVV